MREWTTEEEALNPNNRFCGTYVTGHLIKVANDPRCECGIFTLEEIRKIWDERYGSYSIGSS